MIVNEVLFSCSLRRGLTGGAHWGMTAAWGKPTGGSAAIAMLAAVSSVNIWPSLKSGNYHMALVQVALTIGVAISSYVPVLDPVARNRIVIAFMVINGWFAFQGAEQLRDGDAEAHRQYVAWAQELDGKDGKGGKRGELAKLGDFQPAKQSQVDDARSNANTADKEKATADASANTARTKFNDCKIGCNKDKLKKEAERLEAVAAQKDTDAKTAHNNLEQLSSRLTLTEQAAPIKTRIAELEKAMTDHPDKGEDSNGRWIFQEIFAAFLALVIELANRYLPAAAFRFIMRLAAIPETEVEAAVHEPVEPSPRARAPKPKPVQGIVISMEDRAKVVRSERFKGMSEQQIANTLGWTKSMVHRARHYHEPVHHGLVHAAA